MNISPELFEKFMTVLDKGNKSAKNTALRLMRECKDMEEFKREVKKLHNMEMKKEKIHTLNEVM